MIVIFDGPTTFMTAASYRGITNGPYPKVCENLRGSFEYFTHKNDPDKYQYSESDIELYNGFEIDLSAKDVLKIKKELSELILKQNITEYMEFNMYVQYYLEADYFDVASNNTYYFNSLISSFRHNPEKIKAKYRAIKAEISNLEDTNDPTQLFEQDTCHTGYHRQRQEHGQHGQRRSDNRDGYLIGRMYGSLLRLATPLDMGRYVF